MARRAAVEERERERDGRESLGSLGRESLGRMGDLGREEDVIRVFEEEIIMFAIWGFFKLQTTKGFQVSKCLSLEKCLASESGGGEWVIVGRFR